jgi:hypothetical protein
VTDYRQDKSERFQKQEAERGNSHGGHGRRVKNDISEEFESQTGHPIGEGSSRSPSDRPSGDRPDNAERQRGQHSRKGQAESPRELNLNQPERKREGHR